MNGADVKIAATDLTEMALKFQWIRERFPHLDRVVQTFTFYLSGKWFNYLSIFIAIGFDWSYWFMTALVFRPCDYAQFWDSDTGFIYTMDDRNLSAIHAGAAAAENCPFFTDNRCVLNETAWQV